MSDFGAFFVVLGATYFSVQGQRGGCTGPTFLELFCFLWFAPTNRLPAC